MSSSLPPESLPTFVSRQVSEAKRFFLNLNPDHTSSLQVVCGGVERMREDYIVDRADFPYLAVELVAEGAGSLTICDRSYALSAGSVFAYGPETPHTIRNESAQGMRKYFLDFVGKRGAQLLVESGLKLDTGEYCTFSVGSLHELTEVFDLFLREAGREGALVNPICETLVAYVLFKIRQLRIPEGKALSQSHFTYERIRTCIDQQFLQLENIQQVAAECAVTPVHVSRLFARFSDCGAYQYLVRQKMNYAAGLLMNEGLLVKEVAYKLGFADPFQFSRTFKRVYGISPGKLVAARE